MKRILSVYSLCFVIALVQISQDPLNVLMIMIGLAIGADLAEDISDNFITKDSYLPVVDVLSDIKAGQKAVIFIDLGTKTSFTDKLQRAYQNQKVSLFWVHFRKNQLPKIATELETVGDSVVEMILTLYDVDMIKMNDLELVCYEVGCHAAGIIGRKLKERQINDNELFKVPTIFALNPTGLESINTLPKLQPQDADSVVVLHTTRTIAFEENHNKLGTHDIYLGRNDFQTDEFANEVFTNLITNSTLYLIPFEINDNEEPKGSMQIYGMNEFLSKPGGEYILNYYLPPINKLNTYSLIPNLPIPNIPKGVCEFLSGMDPETDIDIELYSPEHRQNPKRIKANDFNELGNGYFNKSWPTKFIIHGFLSGKNDIDDLAVAFSNDLYGSKTEPLNYVNLISINWEKGARFFYVCAHQYVKDVGEYAGNFIYQAVIAQKMDLSTVEVIGHSLGGHIAGWIGKSLHKYSSNALSIPVIVALDPAGPCYHYANYFSCVNTRPDLELKRTDADEVIVLHTNSRKWSLVCEGYWGLLGTVDVFLNGGMLQNGMENIYSHTWAPVYYRFLMNMEKPLTGYVFNFDDADSLFAVIDSQRLRRMMRNYMKATYRVQIFNGAPRLQLKRGEAIYVDTYSAENSVP